MKVIPSEETVQKEILPRYELLLLTVADFESAVSTLKEAGKDTTELSKILGAIKSRLEEVNASLANKDYFTASQLMDSTQLLMEEFRTELGKSESSQSNLVFMVGILAIVIVSSAILYLFWPYRASKTTKMKAPALKGPLDFELKYGYKKPSVFQRIFSKIRRKKV
jgi:hypothetical protein